MQPATLGVAADPMGEAVSTKETVDEACAEDLAAGRILPRAERVLVEKRARRLTLWFAGYVVREYRVALGREPLGDKERIGDGRTPEGVYAIDGRNGASEFHRSLHVSYPSAADVRQAHEAGAAPGGEIMLHGLPAGAEWVGAEHTRFDWTEGCIAVTNEEIDELWELVANGTPIEIRP
jgi:murein L,D-transpeptidase YafK